MENLDLLRFFFHADSAVSNSHGSVVNGGKFESGGESEFLVFSLLVGFLHRDGHVGQQARDALINVMAMSKKNEKVGNYIARHSNFCPVSVGGSSALFPRAATETAYRLSQIATLP